MKRLFDSMWVTWDFQGFKDVCGRDTKTRIAFFCSLKMYTVWIDTQFEKNHWHNFLVSYINIFQLVCSSLLDLHKTNKRLSVHYTCAFWHWIDVRSPRVRWDVNGVIQTAILHSTLLSHSSFYNSTTSKRGSKT